MDTVTSLLVCAEEQGIDVDWFPMKRAESLSIPLGNGKYGVAIDPAKIKSNPDLIHKLAHEIGHCATGSFYNRFSNFDCRQQHENRADKWAIRKLITADDLDEAVAQGHTEVWDLAEHFGVTEQFMKKAISLYVHGNVAEELYF